MYMHICMHAVCKVTTAVLKGPACALTAPVVSLMLVQPPHAYHLITYMVGAAGIVHLLLLHSSEFDAELHEHTSLAECCKQNMADHCRGPRRQASVAIVHWQLTVVGLVTSSAHAGHWAYASIDDCQRVLLQSCRVGSDLHCFTMFHNAMPVLLPVRAPAQW